MGQVVREAKRRNFQGFPTFPRLPGCRLHSSCGFFLQHHQSVEQKSRQRQGYQYLRQSGLGTYDLDDQKAQPAR